MMCSVGSFPAAASNKGLPTRGFNRDLFSYLEGRS